MELAASGISLYWLGGVTKCWTPSLELGFAGSETVNFTLEGSGCGQRGRADLLVNLSRSPGMYQCLMLSEVRLAPGLQYEGRDS